MVLGRQNLLRYCSPVPHNDVLVNDGPVRLYLMVVPQDCNGAEFPGRTGRICGSGGIFFSVGCGNRSIPSHSAPQFCMHR